MTKPVIGFAGMTHLGLNSAVASAERGFDVICFDPDATRIGALNAGELPVVEPDLPDMFARRRAQLTFTTDPGMLKACDVIYVAPDVPTDDKGTSDLGPIRGLIDRVGEAMAPAAILVILSQVPPGFTRGLRRSLATRYYQVETLIFGRAIERAMYPERFIVGCADPAVPLPPSLATYLAAFECPILPMRYESAELCKISINMVLVAQVTCANTIAELCENIGADYGEIVPALRLDRRIGAYAYISPGMGISGGNLERDLATFNNFGDALGTSTGVVRAWQHNSGYRRNWALRTLHTAVLCHATDPVIAVLGLAYKENTDSVKNSPAVALIEALLPFSIQAYDPVVAPRAQWHPALTASADPIAACAGADVVLIMTPWPEFRTIDIGSLAKSLRGKVVIDPYGMLDRRAALAAGLEYHKLGVS
ncbi:nucleotide sugar dehydrogenase [Tardiphaga robiniae]|uniref:UDP-glucose 6-dehydrogenase n=1 Tax=Tardiphaga robiniae TaxID=943830 RepID=A0A163XB00_9BRAD|nr:nucleotide sugar dehydrogenase [Tardiphaga robiniae]KZD20666.1 GDP-mannose dehydrogenase [Tardiphaga robiniae]